MLLLLLLFREELGGHLFRYFTGLDMASIMTGLGRAKYFTGLGVAGVLAGLGSIRFLNGLGIGRTRLLAGLART